MSKLTRFVAFCVSISFIRMNMAGLPNERTMERTDGRTNDRMYGWLDRPSVPC